jgi:predicted nuclease with RNAse H fold
MADREDLKMRPIVAIGIDLAGSPKRPTGVCRLSAMTASVHCAYSDEEVLEAVTDDARLVAVDAPLSLPRGRCCLESDCDCAGKVHFRECDLELRKMGIKFFPITLGPMRMLTERGMRLKKEIESRGLEVVETFPGGAQDIWGIPRQKDPRGLRRGLKKKGIKGDIDRRGISVHELDAVSCALAARLHVQGRSLVIGDPDEGQMVLPKKAGR